MAKKLRIKIKYLLIGLILISATAIPHSSVKATNCPDVRIVFARGSGGERWRDKNYLAFRDAIAVKLARTELDYGFIDLDYQAIGIDNLEVLVGAYFGAGEAYAFGESVRDGVKKLDEMINNDECANTKYVVGGYSQGAMVVSRALASLNPERLIYAATFGDPKLYLPEGKGAIPAACRGENLSDYRMYVPDCQAYKGLLGAYIPYEPETLVGKVGTWCNGRDIFCSSHLSISDHTAYVAEDLYEDASRVIFAKICAEFGVKNTVASPHDTVILIDSTMSMDSMIEAYKAEGLRLAKETLESGGRVALYDYRDLRDPYEPVKHCDFDTCTLETFQAELDEITTDGGGDAPESLLSASFKVMNELEWKRGATKSVVVLTDSNYLDPDWDGITRGDVVQLSKSIDPVNFYIITNPAASMYYGALAYETDGMVVTNFDELSLLTDYIMERYDSLPRVEEDAEPEEKPMLAVTGVERSGDAVKIGFTTNGTRVVLALNDAVLGMTEVDNGAGTVRIAGVNVAMENIVSLVPLGEDVRGEAVEVRLEAGYEDVGTSTSTSTTKASASAVASGIDMATELWSPKAPDTGKH